MAIEIIVGLPEGRVNHILKQVCGSLAEAHSIGLIHRDILNHQVKSPPEPPSKRAKQPVSLEVEQLLLRCLAKSAADRPASASEIIAELDRVPTANLWTETDARNWWRRHMPNLTNTSTPDTAYSAELAATIVVGQSERSLP